MHPHELDTPRAALGSQGHLHVMGTPDLPVVPRVMMLVPVGVGRPEGHGDVALVRAVRGKQLVGRRVQDQLLGDLC